MAVEPTPEMIENARRRRFSEPPEPYNDPLYRENRQAWFDIIGKSTMLSAIKNNTGLIAGGLIMAVVAAIVKGSVEIGLWGGLALTAGAIVLAGVNAVAGYMDEKMSKTAGRGLDEASKIMEAKIAAKETGREMAVAMDSTIGKELREANAESRKSRESIEEMRREMKTWQERVQQQATHPVSTQIH